MILSYKNLMLVFAVMTITLLIILVAVTQNALSYVVLYYWTHSLVGWGVVNINFITIIIPFIFTIFMYVFVYRELEVPHKILAFILTFLIFFGVITFIGLYLFENAIYEPPKAFSWIADEIVMWIGTSASFNVFVFVVGVIWVMIILYELNNIYGFFLTKKGE